MLAPVAEVIRRIREAPTLKDKNSWDLSMFHLRDARLSLISRAELLVIYGEKGVAVYKSLPRRGSPSSFLELRFGLGISSDAYDDEPMRKGEPIWISKGVRVSATREGRLEICVTSMRNGGMWLPLQDAATDQFSAAMPIAIQLQLAKENAFGYLGDLRYGTGTDQLDQRERPISGLSKIFPTEKQIQHYRM